MVSQARRTSGSDDEMFLREAEKQLHELPESEIVSFDRVQTDFVDVAYRSDL